MKKRLLLVSSDKMLSQSLEQICAQRNIELLLAYSAAETATQWGREETRLTGVIADSMSLRDKERRHLIEIHTQPGAPRLIFLDPPQATYPLKDNGILRRLHWPLDEDLLDVIPEAESVSMVLLAYPTLYLTDMLRDHLQNAGLQSVSVDDSQSLRAALRTSPPAVIVRWSGNLLEAEEWLYWVRQSQPAAHVFTVDSRSPQHAAETDLRSGRAGFLSRRLGESAIDLLLGLPAIDPTSFGRILIVESEKRTLVDLARNLMQDGYDVAACLTPEDALERSRTESYFLAVVGSSLGEGRLSGIALSQQLREIDKNLKIILTVEAYPLKKALEGVTQMVEVGLDDCLLKPIEADRLKFSITRALDRRRLLLENVRLQKAIKATHDELEQLTGFQSKFFAMVAHDVKNPLNAIIGYSDILGMKVKDAQLLRPVGRIKSASLTLNGLISDLVDFAAIESGKLRVNITEMDLLRVVTEISSQVEVAAKKRSIQLQVSAPKQLPVLLGDPLRTGQVLQNLCTNAIQYTPEGGSVHISVAAEKKTVKISVRDTGIGISSEDLPKIFQRFFQAANAQAMRKAGFGLGLKISQEIVKAQGGAMGVDSEVGKGSTFHFTLPLPPSGA